MQWEVGVNGTKPGNEMTFESVNAFFGWIGAMVMGWDEFQLVVIDINNDISESLRTLIIHFMNSRAEATFS